MTRRLFASAAFLALLLLTGCALKDDSQVSAPPDVAAPPKDAHVTPSGLASKMLRVGISSTHPSPQSRVSVRYTGWTTDGKMFENSEFSLTPLSQLIPGWVEGLQLMVVGEKRRFWIPAELAYAKFPDRPQGMLVFDVELLAVR
jgi:FKBP-type peptidyl-prolyl cis-trans isomerase